MQWVASIFHTNSEHGVSSITTADGTHLGRQQSTELTPPPPDLNGLVRCAEIRNLVSARVQSQFNWPLLEAKCVWLIICGAAAQKSVVT